MNIPSAMKVSYILLITCLTVFVLSCSSSKKIKLAVQPIEDKLPSLPESEIDLPIKMYAPPILAKAESVVSKEFTSETWPNYVQPACDFRYKYRFIRSGLSLTCANNIISVQFLGNYQVAGSRCICSMNKPVTPWISGSCGFGNEPMRKVSVRITSQLHFLPSYHVRTNTSLSQLTAFDKCQVSLLSTDVTSQILDSVKSSVNSFCTALDATIADLSFSGILQKAGEKSYQKLNLGKYGYLLVNPTRMRIGQLNYANDTFTVSVGLSCTPELSSDSVNHSAARILPPLTQTENRNQVSLYLNGVFDYPFLSKILSDTLHNKVFEIKGRTIVVKNVVIRGIGKKQVELQVDFAGSNKGSIYLRGTPWLDTAKQTLTIPDLSYSLESQDLALKMARTLFKNKIRKSIQGKSYLDIAALVKANLGEFNTQLNRQLTVNVSSSGTAKDARIIGLLARQDALQVQVYVKAEVSATMQGLF